LEALLLAERAALLTGRDQDFTMVLTIGYTGLRWGEVIGLEHGLASGGASRAMPGELSRVEGGPGLVSGLALSRLDRVAVRPGGRRSSWGWRCVASFSW
jgi:hypothetical protein